MKNQIPDEWRQALAAELETDRWQRLQQFLESEYQQHTVFPPQELIFTALQQTSLSNVKAVILGQDPYHDDGQAHGLSFSVQKGVRLPPSLRNIYQELRDDLQIETPDHGCLINWAEQGVLLLNTVLTVRAHEANSHRKQGWEEFTDAVIGAVNQLPSVAFVLWGRPAQKKAALIDRDRHLIIESAHPSPLSARRGFIGSRPFSQLNHWLAEQGKEPIDWALSAEERMTPRGR